MRRPVLLIFVNAMILIVVFALLTQSLVIIQRLAKADKISGLVEVSRSDKGEWKPLDNGGLIKTGDRVRSGNDGTAEFRWADGTRWKIMPATEIKVGKSTHNMVQKADQSQLQLMTGKVFIRIIKALQPTSKFEVETPTAVAAARGTVFSVEVKNGKTSVAVLKGEVQVSSAGAGDIAEDTITSGKAAVSAYAGELHQENAASELAAFASQTSIVQPDLSAQTKPISGNRILVSGTTETGNKVTINGKKVRVLGNGQFRYRALAENTSVFTIISTDKHGVRATRVLRCNSSSKTVCPT